MKKLRFPIILFWLFGPAMLPATFAQQKGVVEGRLLNRTNPSNFPGNVELEVLELSAGMGIIRVENTDSTGRFRIENLPEDQPLMIRAIYQGANYHSMVGFDSSGKAEVDIEVFESTSSLDDLEVAESQMAFQAVGDQLQLLETYTITNNSNPPRTCANPEGNFRISKPPGILEPPRIRVTAPGSSMPVTQTALESPDGQSYYTLYPLRPGTTQFAVEQLLPYTNRSYTYTKEFYFDMGSVNIGVLPMDVVLSGQDVKKIQTNSQENFSVYMSPPVKAGTKVEWTFSGGTPVSPTASSQAAGGSTVQALPNFVGRNTFIIGPFLLMGFILVLWYAYNHPKGRKTEL